MAPAYKCALTGAVIPGKGKNQVEVDLNNTVKLRVIVLEKFSDRGHDLSDVSPDGEKAIADALKAIKIPVGK